MDVVGPVFEKRATVEYSSAPHLQPPIPHFGIPTYALGTVTAPLRGADKCREHRKFEPLDLDFRL